MIFLLIISVFHNDNFLVFIVNNFFFLFFFGLIRFLKPYHLTTNSLHLSAIVIVYLSPYPFNPIYLPKYPHSFNHIFPSLLASHRYFPYFHRYFLFQHCPRNTVLAYPIMSLCLAHRNRSFLITSKILFSLNIVPIYCKYS